MTCEARNRMQGQAGQAAMVAALAAAALGGLALYLLQGQGAAPAAGPLPKLVIANNADYVGTCPVTVAQRLGYFAEAGVEVALQPHKSGKASLEAALAGKADMATTADIPIMLAAMNNVPVSVVATFFKTEHDHGIVARRDRGFATLADMKGKTIGVTLATSGHFVLDAFLSRQHLRPADVTMRNLKPEEFAAALERGEVDAIATWEPFLDNLLIQLGANGAVFYGEDIYEIPYSLVGRRDYVERHPELMKKLLRALARGVQDCKTRPEAARAIIAQTVKSDTRKWQAQWPNYRFQLVLDQGLILALEDEASWAISNKLVAPRETPNFIEYMHLDAMAAVAPTGVTVVH
jgi:NitT/TauT family transport system substrate-binding protein